jgi:hypothetical protein
MGFQRDNIDRKAAPRETGTDSADTFEETKLLI